MPQIGISATATELPVFYEPGPGEVPNAFAELYSNFLNVRLPAATALFEARLRALDPTVKAQALLRAVEADNARVDAMSRSFRTSLENQGRLLSAASEVMKTAIRAETDLKIENSRARTERSSLIQQQGESLQINDQTANVLNQLNAGQRAREALEGLDGSLESGQRAASNINAIVRDIETSAIPEPQRVAALRELDRQVRQAGRASGDLDTQQAAEALAGLFGAPEVGALPPLPGVGAETGVGDLQGMLAQLMGLAGPEGGVSVGARGIPQSALPGLLEAQGLDPALGAGFPQPAPQAAAPAGPSAVDLVTQSFDDSASALGGVFDPLDPRIVPDRRLDALLRTPPTPPASPPNVFSSFAQGVESVGRLPGSMLEGVISGLTGQEQERPDPNDAARRAFEAFRDAEGGVVADDDELERTRLRQLRRELRASR
jgi:hypothetical protein